MSREPEILPLFIVNAYELYTATQPETLKIMLDWFRANDRNVYRSALATLTQARKLRPAFVEKKSLAEQYAWFYKTLKMKSCDEIGENLLQAYLMSAEQEMLAAFCDAMGIEHNGQGAVEGALPDELDSAKLDQAIDILTEKFTTHPPMIAMYLHCFNLQRQGGWPNLSEKLASDARLKLA